MPISVSDLSPHARDLAETTGRWSERLWDPEVAMVRDPPSGEGWDHLVLHRVPDTLWFAHSGLLLDGEARAAQARAGIEAVLDLQYPPDAGVAAGTYRKLLETPPLPPEPVMWDDYDPNWRQFVGTALALVLIDHPGVLGPALTARVEASIDGAVRGEPDGRIPSSYTNPALMRAWLDAWWGARTGERALVDRGLDLGRRVVERFERDGAFDEFNSPTYYGVDLYALAFWQRFAPDPWFAERGEQLARSVWDDLATFHHADLRAFCGPATRTYHPDPTFSVALASLWLWAVCGRDRVAVPPLDAPTIHHGHDLMWGPLVARLASLPDGVDPARLVRSRVEEETVERTIGGGREVSACIAPRQMTGAESSGHDWGGWDQMVPITLHGDGGERTVTVWLERPHRVRARAVSPTTVVATIEGPSAPVLRVHGAASVHPGTGGVELDRLRLCVTAAGRNAVDAVAGDRVRLAPDAGEMTIQLDERGI